MAFLKKEKNKKNKKTHMDVSLSCYLSKRPLGFIFQPNLSLIGVIPYD
jgi:hypothetical protein